MTTHIFLYKFLFLFLLLNTALTLKGQNGKKPLNFEDYHFWKKLEGSKISSNGAFVAWHEVPGYGDQTMQVHTTGGQTILTYQRGEDSDFSNDSKYLVFQIKPALESINALKRKNTDKDDLPKDSLGIYNLESGTLVKLSHVRSYTLPEEWDGMVAFYLEPQETADTTKNESKKASEENGFHLVVYHLENGTSDTIPYVKNFRLAKAAHKMIYHTTGVDSVLEEGVYYYDFTTGKSSSITSGSHQYQKVAISEDGTQAAILLDTAEKKAYLPKTEIRYWNNEMDEANVVANQTTLRDNWIVNPHHDINFSEDGTKLFFHTSPPPMIKDTTLLEEEVVQVEIWSYRDQRLHTQQNVQQDQDVKRGYDAVYDIPNARLHQLGSKTIPDIWFADDSERNKRYALGENSTNYMMNISWEGFPPRRDLYLIDQQTGSSQLIKTANKGVSDISPGGHFIHWEDQDDTTYYVYHIQSGTTSNISGHIPTSLVDELDDHPDFPGFYGIAGWTQNDEHVLIYDRYDIWKVNPKDPSDISNMTYGRSDKNRYRLRKLDEGRRYFDLTQDILHMYNESSRHEAFVRPNADGTLTNLLSGGFKLRNLQKAKHTDVFIYTAENNHQFGDVQATVDEFATNITLSNANPQQASKKWCSVELINWTSLDGVPLEGLLYKPEDFDPDKKYPLLVYFYERNSHNLHSYWGAVPHRSIINPTFYASRGYLIFIPDIVYKDGYPGPSCYNAVIPGITHLIDQGFVDTERIGTQGHSWGGYQTAYLVTRTDIFKCAESGAPVSNMTSAYGGIRWGTGLSRMFQYERTQSRIGGTLWEYPMRYIENSPIFFVDKINTPLLLMHNDKDGAVPWYQGIEFFVALRRLGKPAWMLNYNNEPHWPVKWENKVDFNIRMQQFFDHYLMDQPMPEWMKHGIPAIEKGYNKGY